MNSKQLLKQPKSGKKAPDSGPNSPSPSDSDESQKIHDMVIRIAGNSQDGIQSIGDFLARYSGRSQLGVVTFQTFPATISGGPSIYQMRIGSGKIRSAGDEADILVVFYQHSFDAHIETLRHGGLLIYDSDHMDPPKKDEKFHAIGIPMTSLTIEAIGGNSKSKGKNLFLLGLLTRIFDFDLEVLEGQIEAKFKPKGDKVFTTARDAFHVGYGYDMGDILYLFQKDSARSHNQVTCNGNQALVLGAIAAGVRFGAGYPITPWSSSMEMFRQELPKYGGMFIQAEDELSAVAMATGASYADRVAVTGSSGPGLALKSETMGFCVMAEIPLVIVDVMRGGPSTGLPTKVEQTDLNQAVFGGHGDCPRVVIAPSNVGDCFYAMIEAVNLAREYRIPVIFLSDQSLGTRVETWEEPDLSSVMQDISPTMKPIPKGYKPYEYTEKGVVPQYVPGSYSEDGIYPVATGLEHNELGHPDGSPATHMKMTAKRRRKLQHLAKNLPTPRVYGPEKGKILIVGWGSTEGPIQEAVDEGQKRGMSISSVHLRCVSPLPPGLKEIFENFDHIFVAELNDTGIYGFGGQMATILRSVFCMDKIIGINKTDGLTFKIREILGEIAYSLGDSEERGIKLATTKEKLV